MATSSVGQSPWAAPRLSPRAHRRPRPCSDSEPDLTVRFLDDRVVVGVRGELDLATAPALSELLAGLAGGHVDVELDLRHLTFLDGTGAEALVHAALTMGGRHEVVLRSPTPPVARLLAVLSVTDHVRSCPDQPVGHAPIPAGNRRSRPSP